MSLLLPEKKGRRGERESLFFRDDEKHIVRAAFTYIFLNWLRGRRLTLDPTERNGKSFVKFASSSSMPVSGSIALKTDPTPLSSKGAENIISLLAFWSGRRSEKGFSCPCLRACFKRRERRGERSETA